MTEEIKYEHDHEHECFCKSKGFRKFLTVALGTFVGGFCAISLFCALHKPPMMMGPMGYGQYGMFAPYHNCNCPCHKIMKKHCLEKKMMKYNKDFKDSIKDEKEEIND